VLQVHDNTLASIPRSSQDGRAPTLSIACPQLYRGQHPQGVNDIAFATPAFSDHVLASVGEGGELVLWDIREQQPTAVVKQAHSQAANTVRFHPGIPGYLVTGKT
jgi:WD40 repeat protein